MKLRRIVVTVALVAASLLVTAPEAPAAAAVPTPTSLALHDGSVYAASWALGIVFRMEILAGGALAPPVPYAEDFTNPLGIVFAPDGTLFVADSHPSEIAGRQTAGRVQAMPPGGGAPELVVDELPNGRHNANNLAVHGDRLYITNGNSTDDASPDEQPGEVPPFTGSLLSVPLTARGIVLDAEWDVPKQMSVEAVGMRNVYDVAFRPGTDEAWMPVNGPDTLDPFGEDTLVKAVVADGPGRRAPGRRGAPARAPDDFGFPDCVYEEGAGGPTDPVVGDNVNHPGDCADRPHTPPEVLLGLHVSADGLAFGPGGDSPWGSDLYIAEFGNFFGNEVVGHRIVRVPVDSAGNVTGPPETVIFMPTPLDVLFGPAGTGMYIADFGGGQIVLLPFPPG
jgi:glucose/arabinose dehydrogenase